MDPELLAELGEKEEAELVAVVGLPPDRLDRLGHHVPDRAGAPLYVLFDRPASPGNLGTLIRSADAFGAEGLIVSGHAADPYDPRAVRASTGSIFALPVVRASATDEVLAWAASLRLVGTDERATVDVGDADLRGPTLLAGRQRDAGVEQRLAAGRRRDGADPDRRGGVVAQRGGRGHDRALRGVPAAHPTRAIAVYPAGRDDL